MNILQILPELNVGGVETGTVDLAKYLARSGHKAIVVSAGGALTDELAGNGVRHYTLAVNKKNPLTMLRSVGRVSRIIREEKIDVVHARSRVPAWVGYCASRRTKTVFITTCHGYYRRHPFSRVMGWGKRVIVLSNVIARHMIDDFGVPRERIRLISRGVDIGKFSFVRPDTKRGKQFHVGIIGRMTPLKGHIHFIRAMALAARAIPALKIWIVGDAPSSKAAYKEDVEIMVRRLGLWQNTEFLGNQRAIGDILAQLDVLVLSTVTHEAFGRVIIEAQASGVPVVATKVGGVIDIIEDGKTGFLVPPADPGAMADAVVRIYRDKEIAVSFAQDAYRKVKEEYTAEKMMRSTLKVYEEALGSFKVLIIKLSSLGDVILSTPAFSALRRRFPPPCRISILVGEEAKEPVLRCPDIDEVIVADMKHKDKGIRALLKLGASVRRAQYDIVVDLQNNRASHILSFLSAASDRYGYDNGKWGFLLNNRVRDDKAPIDPVSHQFRVLSLLGITPASAPPGGARLRMWPSESDRVYVDEFLTSEWLLARQKLIGINISARRRWATKALPDAHMARVCDELGKRNMRIVLTGTSADIPEAQALIAKVKSTRLINACGKTTINQLACLIARCCGYISGDSAPLHIAAAMGTPCVALFGPTDPKRHLPPARNCVVIKKDIECGPCYRPTCRHTKCMEAIKPDEIVRAVESLLKD